MGGRYGYSGIRSNKKSFEKEDQTPPVYGYPIHNECFYKTIISWIKTNFDWEIDKDWITCSPGIVPAINIAVMTLTEKGDEVIIQPPVYPPFFDAVKKHDRKLVENPLKYDNGLL